VQPDVAEQRRDRGPLPVPSFPICHRSVFEHARLEPLLDQADDARVADPALDEADQPVWAEFVEERADVGVPV
jgi:hypothetical protein